MLWWFYNLSISIWPVVQTWCTRVGCLDHFERLPLWTGWAWERGARNKTHMAHCSHLCTTMTALDLYSLVHTSYLPTFSWIICATIVVDVQIPSSNLLFSSHEKVQIICLMNVDFTESLALNSLFGHTVYFISYSIVMVFYWVSIFCHWYCSIGLLIVFLPAWFLICHSIQFNCFFFLNRIFSWSSD
jgi:hypothetical protein